MQFNWQSNLPTAAKLREGGWVGGGGGGGGGGHVHKLVLLIYSLFVFDVSVIVGGGSHTQASANLLFICVRC